MNVIFILCDTLVREKLSPYHQHQGPYAHIRTPNLERLAEKCVTFTQHWINSAPCMPARRDLWSGRIEFPWRSWGPRESFDPDWTLALRQSNVTTALCTDHANLFDVGSGNYHFFFDEYRFVRGHFNDHCAITAPIEPGRNGMTRRVYEEMRAAWDSEENSFVARNLTNVCEWLNANADNNRPFFLCVDEFDPHWPLDPPEPYRSMYLDDPSLAKKNLSTFYKGGSAEEHTEEQIRWLQAQCAGKITMVDHWLGKVFDTMDQLDLWQDTMLIVTTDHGEFLGEYGLMSKGSGFNYPLFARIPLFVYHPETSLAGKACNALSCAVDLHATALDALGQPVSEHSHGHSLLPLLSEDKKQVRNSVLYGWWGRGFYWTDGNYLLCKGPESPGPLYQYGTNFGEKWVGIAPDYFDRYSGGDCETGQFLPHTDRPVYRVPMDGMAYANPKGDFDALFNLTDDPSCMRNLYASVPDLSNRCLGKLIKAMQEISVPEEHFQRLGLCSS